jgi:hypothetical protein
MCDRRRDKLHEPIVLLLFLVAIVRERIILVVPELVQVDRIEGAQHPEVLVLCQKTTACLHLLYWAQYSSNPNMGYATVQQLAQKFGAVDNTVSIAKYYGALRDDSCHLRFGFG